MTPRLIFLLVLLLAAGAVAADHWAARQRGANVTPIRAGEAGTLGRPSENSGGSVDKFCGFAPCGMPLPCE